MVSVTVVSYCIIAFQPGCRCGCEVEPCNIYISLTRDSLGWLTSRLAKSSASSGESGIEGHKRDEPGQKLKLLIPTTCQ